MNDQNLRRGMSRSCGKCVALVAKAKSFTADLLAQRFGKLTVVSGPLRVGNARGRVAWSCLCECGNTKTIAASVLRNGHAVSCGCFRRMFTTAKNTTHGKNAAPEYSIWWAMRQRCEYSRCKAFANYGARGIRVCDEWTLDFAAFLKHVGPRPSPKHSIDRINNDGNYEPGNVRWTTPKEQMRNTRSNVLVDVDGHRACLSEWSDRCGIKASIIGARVRRGWSHERAVTEPPRRCAKAA